MQTVKVKLTGTRPLLMHADTFSDPLNKLTKAHKQLTSKMKKTDEDHELIARSEWRGALYWSEDIGPYIPGVNIEAALVAGGKLSKLGAQIKRSVEIVEERVALQYDGPRAVEKLFNDGYFDVRSVKIQRARLMRYRPIFRRWAVECTIMYDQENIDETQIIKSLTDAGEQCGLCDYRPKFGRFSIAIV